MHEQATDDHHDAGARLAGNPLRTQADLRRAAFTLCLPVETHRSAGGARIRITGPHATYSDPVQEMEGFCRLLWGIAPLVAGGATYPYLDRIREGLSHGCDPRHPEYWGEAGHRDQRLVECAAIAYALLLARDAFWDPLPPAARQRVARYLAIINERQIADNNWRFFRVLINLALAWCDAPLSTKQLRADFDRLDTFYLADGWYFDGCNRAVDYYAAFGMHFYGLLCAPLLRAIDVPRSRTLIERATAFAGRFAHWFSSDGGSLPYGRSLTYRFAPAAFWGALAHAGVEALPWGVIKGLTLRHLRWWFRQPILSDSGLLTIGYAYPNQIVADRYTSACSPYWALKSLLPLALSADAPFWRADEQPLPSLHTPFADEHSGMLMCRDHDGHVLAFTTAARVSGRVRSTSAKYGKFSYSTRFGFNLPASLETLPAAAQDSALALSERGDTMFRTRAESDAVEISSTHIVSHWKGWPDVLVTTWLVPMSPWHVRVHRIRTARPLTTAEGGFAIGLGPEEATWRPWEPASPDDAPPVWIAARTAQGLSIVVNLRGDRRAEAIRADPNTNVLAPRTILPTLHADLDPGEHWLACAVAATGTSECAVAAMTARPAFLLTVDGFEIRDGQSQVVLREIVDERRAVASLSE